MDINKINQEVEKLNSDKAQKSGILNLIDHKINNDMEKVLTKIEAVNNAINAKFDGVNAKFDGVNTKFDGVKSEVATLKWLIGGIGITILIAALKYVFFA